jgi:acyl-CoA synthetase (AMP-forming)/AMP-acid ligase II
MFAVPGMLSRIANEAEQSDHGQLGSLRRVLYGVAPVGTDELKRLIGQFGPTLSQLYGRYEAGWPLTILTPNDHERLLSDDEEVVGSCGRAIDAVEIELRPARGNPDRRELRSRSDMVSSTFADPDGWCSLGDPARITEHGYLHLTGRLDGMINTGSFHVYPDEVQEAILELPSITAVLVTGEPDPTWGQAVTAYVVSTDSTIAATLRQQLSNRLAPYKIPQAVHVVNDLPGHAQS